MYTKNLLEVYEPSRKLKCNKKTLPCLHLYIYEILFNCNKIVVVWNWCFVICILFSRFPAFFHMMINFFIFYTGWQHGFCHLRREVEVTTKSLNCATAEKAKTPVGKNQKCKIFRFFKTQFETNKLHCGVYFKKHFSSFLDLKIFRVI